MAVYASDQQHLFENVPRKVLPPPWQPPIIETDSSYAELFTRLEAVAGRVPVWTNSLSLVGVAQFKVLVGQAQELVQRGRSLTRRSSRWTSQTRAVLHALDDMRGQCEAKGSPERRASV